MMENTTNIYEQAADYQRGYEQALKDLSAQLKSDLPIAVHRDCSEIDYEIAYTLYGMRGKIDRAIAKLQRDLSFPKKEIVEKIREEFPKGARVVLVEMDDPQAPPAGTEGTVVCVDDIGSLVVKWDNGSGLHVAYGKDKCKKIEKSEEEKC